MASFTKDGPLRVPKPQADWTEERHQHTAKQIWGAIDRKLWRRRMLRRASWATMPMIVVGAFIAIYPAYKSKTTAALPPTPTAPNDGARRIHFHEGSVATLLTPSASLRLEGADTHQILAVLAQGKALFQVANVPERRFTVNTHNLSIEVLATRFTVERRETQTFVACDEGEVHVRWSGGSRTLVAGGAGLFPPSVPPVKMQAAVPQSVTPARNVMIRKATHADSPQVPSVAVVRPDVETLLELANRALRDGHLEKALALLDEAILADPNHALAAVAGLTKARVLLDGMHDLAAVPIGERRG